MFVCMSTKRETGRLYEPFAGFLILSQLFRVTIHGLAYIKALLHSKCIPPGVTNAVIVG